jgi:hypothetical protein
MIVLSTMLARMKTGALIFHVANSLINVGISKSALELEQVNVNFLEAIQHSRTGSVWYNPEYER